MVLVEAEPEPPSSLSRTKASQAREQLLELANRLQGTAADLDKFKVRGKMFNPTSPSLVGPFISLGLLAQDRYPLAERDGFYGSGVYALYYRGGFEPYAPISGTEHPIYIGKADPSDPLADTPDRQGPALFQRLSEHARSIRHASGNLAMADFDFRALVITSGWQASAESFLIRLYKPVWNNETGVCHGIGKHGDDAETRANGRSPWDTLHPGRKWAAKSPHDQVPEPAIRASIAQHFAENPPIRTHKDAIEGFFAALR